MNLEEAERLLITGRYAELLRAAVPLATQARLESRPSDELRWTLLAGQACRHIGRLDEALAHAALAENLAAEVGDAESRSRSRLLVAGAHSEARQFDDALAELQAALEFLPAEGCESTRAEVLLAQAEIGIDTGLRPQAEAALARGSALAHWLRDSRLLSWSLYLRSQFEETSPADLQLSAAYEVARTVGCPELQWQILWRLSDRAAQQGRAKMQEDCLWNALSFLTRLAENLDPEDAANFWRQGSRRTFMDAVQRRFGASFLQMVMLGGGGVPGDAGGILRDMGFDPASIPDFVRRPAG